MQSGCFGAVLMKTPDLVADCVARMMDASPVEVTVKCRIGVDDQVPDEVLPAFLDSMRGAGVRRIAIHARKAWLKQEFPALHLSVNGGIGSFDAVRDHLRLMDGVMVGRAAYHQPWDILGGADRLWGDTPPFDSPEQVAQAMRPYIARHLAAGGRLHQVTRHMLGLFHGMPGARGWKRTLSEGASKGGIEVYDAALRQVTQLAA